MLRLCAKTCFYLSFTCHFIQFASAVLHCFKLSGECCFNSFTFWTLLKLPDTWLIQIHLFLWQRHNDIVSENVKVAVLQIKASVRFFRKTCWMSEFFAWCLRLSFLTQSTWLEQTTHLLLTSARFFNNTSMHGWNRLRYLFTFKVDFAWQDTNYITVFVSHHWSNLNYPWFS